MSVRKILIVLVALGCGFLSQLCASMVVTPWIPIFKGVDRAAGTNFADAAVPRYFPVACVRVDLADPDVRFLPSPRSPTWSSPETLAYSVSNYLRIHALQVAVNCNF